MSLGTIMMRQVVLAADVAVAAVCVSRNGDVMLAAVRPWPWAMGWAAAPLL
jgi:hypothetical protein